MKDLDQIVANQKLIRDLDGFGLRVPMVGENASESLGADGKGLGKGTHSKKLRFACLHDQPSSVRAVGSARQNQVPALPLRTLFKNLDGAAVSDIVLPQDLHLAGGL